ncbi:pyridoxal-dependent decarboxylase [Immersiella caudata]|uniref:ornithine decarboxylase n=1 Tax=Immersiella caudata TaxID=314043 RepID=A0AA39U6L1_9PEZI|nr:pyridoxal-dependent decarboxylase [Immersiella caudata]
MAASEPLSDRHVDELIRKRIAELEEIPFAPRADLPFIVADWTKTLRQHQRWIHLLPQIQPFYAVKCNPDRCLLRFLADLGLGFDCASSAEIQLVLGLGIDPSRIIFSHPCKAISALQMASSRGVLLATFDNSDELDKIKSVSPNMQLLLRVYAQDDTARSSLGKKFGAHLNTTHSLLLKARALDLKVVGVNFHIGSAAFDPKAFLTAARDARRVFDEGRELGFDMTILDVGGGFQDSNFDSMASSLQLAIEHEFPGWNVRLMAEPGRFYASSYYTLACKVISRRKHSSGGDSSAQVDMLYQNDGIYGCFLSRLTEDGSFAPTLIPVDKGYGVSRSQGRHIYSLWGPTCDSVDCISEGAALHCEAMVGDWLKYQNMGAYTAASSTSFNGFPNVYEILYVTPRLMSGRETWGEVPLRQVVIQEDASCN